MKPLLQQEARTFILWIPVFIGLGIGLYFSLPTEPSLGLSLSALFISALFFFISRKKEFLRFLALAVLFVTLGFSVVHLRTQHLGTFLLNYPTSSQNFTGILEKVEKKPRGLRLTLSQVIAEKTKFRKPLQKVRITLRGKTVRDLEMPQAGDLISVRAVLLPPPGPVAAYAYDFRRKAYFDGLSAIGYGTGPFKILKTSGKRTLSHWIEAEREKITAHLATLIGDKEGAIAAALVTGDRSGIDDTLRDTFANSGIAHILAISGLHLSIIAGLVFLIIRRGLCFVPALALRFNTKKVAAGAAILFTFLYLTLADFALPAQRAFIMTSIIMLAILTDRTALTLRNVAFAASFILLLLPESLLSVSFQLSFAAVISLVAGYEAVRFPLARWASHKKNTLRKAVLYIGGICLSTFLATAATTPLTIYTFNRFTLHAIEANLIAIPLLSFVIMPLLLFFFILSLVGIENWITPAIKISIALMAWIAERVSSWEGSAIGVPQISVGMLSFFIFGALLLCLLKTKLRTSGFVFLCFFLWGTCTPQKPEYFVSADQKLIAKIEGDDTGVVNSLRPARFARETWQKMTAVRSLKKDPELHLPIKISLPKAEGGVFVYKNASLLTAKAFVGKRPWAEKYDHSFQKKRTPELRSR